MDQSFNNSMSTIGTIDIGMSEDKCVSFDPFVIVRKGLHVSDYSDDEFNNSWYTNDEWEIMRDDVETTIEIMENGKFDQGNDWYCPRGLESKTASGMKTQRRIRQRSWDAVLDEQDRQCATATADPSVISLVYWKHSRDPREVAHRLAQQDQKDSSLDPVENQQPRSACPETETNESKATESGNGASRQIVQTNSVLREISFTEKGDFPLSLCLRRVSETTTSATNSGPSQLENEPSRSSSTKSWPQHHKKDTIPDIVTINRLRKTALNILHKKIQSDLFDSASL